LSAVRGLALPGDLGGQLRRTKGVTYEPPWTPVMVFGVSLIAVMRCVCSIMV